MQSQVDTPAITSNSKCCTFFRNFSSGQILTTNYIAFKVGLVQFVQIYIFETHVYLNICILSFLCFENVLHPLYLNCGYRKYISSMKLFPAYKSFLINAFIFYHRQAKYNPLLYLTLFRIRGRGAVVYKIWVLSHFSHLGYFQA